MIYNVLSVSDEQKEGLYLHINFQLQKEDLYLYIELSASVSIDVIEAPAENANFYDTE